jgi:flagellar basal-body rod protein FlgF
VTRGLHAAAAAMAVQLQKQDVYANNLANASTVGYRRAEVTVGSFQRLLQEAGEGPALRVPANDTTTLDLSPGPVHETGDPFDLALVGPGLFTLQTDSGLRYTRDGRFHLDEEGRLLSTGDHQVMGREGPIVLPGRELSVTESGQVLSGGQLVDVLFIAEFEPSDTLTRENDGLLSATTGPSRSEDGEQTAVKQGFVEEANVTVVRELSSMMAGFRAFEASAAALRLHDETLGVLIDSTGK